MRTIAVVVGHVSQIRVGDWFCKAAKGTEPCWVRVSKIGKEELECHTAYGEPGNLTLSYLEFKLKRGPLFLMR